MATSMLLISVNLIVCLNALMLRFPMDKIEGNMLIGDFNAIVHNNPVLVDGIRGKAISFNGVNQWADYGLHECFSDVTQCTDGYSFAVWLKLPESMLIHNVTDLYIMSSGGQTGGVKTGGMAVYTFYGKLTVIFNSQTDGINWPLPNIEVPAEEWFHLAATWNKYGYLTVFIDGSEVDRVESRSKSYWGSVSDSNMHLGKPQNGFQKYGEVLIDEWYFWDITLDAEDIKDVYDEYAKDTGELSILHDGNASTCFTVENVTKTQDLLHIGAISILKDPTSSRAKFAVVYNNSVNCENANIYYKDVDSSCGTFLKATANEGSAVSGMLCHYELLCNQGNVVCGMELIVAGDNLLSDICDII